MKDPKRLLRNRLEENPLKDERDLYLYIQDAGRLASLGSRYGIKELKEILSRPQYAGKIDELIKERVAEGLWDLSEQLVEELGYSIIECQDFYSFSRHCGDMISDESRRRIEEWVESAENQSLQNETVDILEQFLITFPIEERDQIAPVYAPLSEIQLQMLDKVLIGGKDRQKMTFVKAETIDGQWVCKVPNKAGVLIVKKERTDKGELRITLSGPGSKVRGVSVGPLPAKQTGPDQWDLIVPVIDFTEPNQEYLLGPAPVRLQITHWRYIACG